MLKLCGGRALWCERFVVIWMIAASALTRSRSVAHVCRVFKLTGTFLSGNRDVIATGQMGRDQRRACTHNADAVARDSPRTSPRQYMRQDTTSK